MKKLAPHLELGSYGEDVAANFLKGLGYQILARNWRKGRLELDIICRDGNSIVFVEVKTRRTIFRGGPAAALTGVKITRLFRAAQFWLMEHGLWETPCRFDVICILGAADNSRLEHYRNAFDETWTLDCGNANWQP